MARIVGVKHDSSGEIAAFKLDNGKEISKQDGVRMAEEGSLEGVIIGTSKKGEKYLRSSPDDSDSNNLNKLDEFK